MHCLPVNKETHSAYGLFCGQGRSESARWRPAQRRRLALDVTAAEFSSSQQIAAPRPVPAALHLGLHLLEKNEWGLGLRVRALKALCWMVQAYCSHDKAASDQ